MGSTYHSLHYHWVCSTKERSPFIRDDWGPHFHEYLGGTVGGLGGVAVKVGGVADHVHALIGLKPSHRISDFVRELKKATTNWAVETHEKRFHWQEGYSIFSVSKSGIAAVTRYIEKQPEHHQRMTFIEELQRLLEKHEIDYDPKYLT